MKDDKWRLLSKYENIIIRDFRNKIKENPNPELLRDLYLYIKEIAPLFYGKDGMDCAYQILKDIIIESELAYDGQYIVDTLPDFKDYNELFMDKLVHHMRLFLLKKCWVRKCDYERALREIDFVNYCVESSDKIKYMCNQLGIECKSLVIHPGFEKEANLYYGCGHHAFNIITFCGEHYLVDCTYRQFFELGDNIIERIGVVGLSGCKPGAFMLMDEDRKHLAEELIKKGYVKKVQSETDKREFHLQVTERYYKYWNLSEKYFEIVEKRIKNSLTDEEYEFFNKIMKKVSDDLMPELNP